MGYIGRLLLSALLLFASGSAMSQSTLPLRADTILFEKTGGNAEFKLRNSTRDTLGILVNIGGGRTRFMRARQIDDTTIVIPPSDTIRIRRGSNSVAPIDVFLIAGQSNAQGQGASASSPVPTTGTVFKFYSEAISAGVDPVGNANTGSAWPQFGIQYYASTSRMVLLVPSAVSGTSQTVAANTGQGTWDTTGVLFDSSVARLNRALVAATAAGFNPVFKGVLWCQGENDANAINATTITQAAYTAAFSKMIGRYRTSLGKRTPFYIFRTGTINGGSDVGYDSVRTAQESVVDNDSLTSIVFYNARYFLSRGLMPDTYHYTQAGYNEMGSTAAINIVGRNTQQIQTQTTNRFLDVGNLGIGKGSGIPAAPLDVRAPSSSTASALFTGRVGIGTTSPLYPLDVRDSMSVRNTLFFSNLGFGGAPSIRPSTFLTFLGGTNGLVIYQGVNARYMEHRFTGPSGVTPLNQISGIINGFNFNSNTIGLPKQSLMIVTSGQQMATNHSAGPIILKPGTNVANNGTDTAQYSDDSVIIDVHYGGEMLVRGKTTLQGQVKLGTPVSGTTSDSVLLWHPADSTVRKIAASSLSGASPALTTNYIGYGISSVLSGSAAYQYNGTQVTQENAAAVGLVSSTDAAGATSGGYMRLAVQGTPSASSQQLGRLEFISRRGGTNADVGAFISAVSRAAWTGGTSHSTSLAFGVTSAGNSTPSIRMTIMPAAGVYAGGSSFATTSMLQMAAGTTTLAPLLFTSGTNNTTPQAGAMEYDGTNFYLNPSTTRKRIPLTDNATPANGQIPIGNGTDYTVAAITGGTGVTVTNGAGSITLSTGVLAGSVSQAGTATTVFTVTIGTTQANTTYKVNVTPTNALSAALFYVTNKTTTTFDVTYLAGLTGTVQFDWSLHP